MVYSGDEVWFVCCIYGTWFMWYMYDKYGTQYTVWERRNIFDRALVEKVNSNIVHAQVMGVAVQVLVAVYNGDRMQ